MKLYEGKSGNFYTVEAVNQEKLGDKRTGRLKALGVVEGTGLLLLNKKKSGTAAIKVRGTRLALGREYSESIEILPLEK